MKILRAISHGLSAINPIHVGENLMSAALQKLAISALKGVIGTFIAALLAFQHVVPASNDPITVGIWGAIITGVHLLGTLLQHLLDAANADKA